jgi:endoglycosylceramidase
VQGPISATGGPFLRDKSGRVVFLHGVNAVYKYAPYELYPAPGKPWDFSAADAARIAGLGFNVVRLGVIWEGLEPGSGGPNDPALCARGKPGDPHQLSPTVVNGYLDHVEQTINLLGQYGVYTLLDMHQDVYNQLFRGEGAPNWAVCTDGLRIRSLPGRWSNDYAEPALDAAYADFWRNDIAGDFEGEYIRNWGLVASRFRDNPWLVGYDLINEPFSTSLLALGQRRELDFQIQCLYAGSAHPGTTADTREPVPCDRDDPAEGIIPTIQAVDPTHLIFAEPDIFTARGLPNYVGPMDFPSLVLNFHDYCGKRSGVTGNPTDLAACTDEEARTIRQRAAERPTLATSAQASGPAWFMSEFGATRSPALLSRLTNLADQALLGWSYWSWKYYHDPTGSADEALVDGSGRLEPTAAVLSRTYPQAVAGTPTAVAFDPASSAFSLEFVPDDSIHAPTVIFVPVAMHYPHGYCPSAAGGTVISKPGATDLQIANTPGASRVSVRVSAGNCGQRGRA